MTWTRPQNSVLIISRILLECKVICGHYCLLINDGLNYYIHYEVWLLNKIKAVVPFLRRKVAFHFLSTSIYSPSVTTVHTHALQSSIYSSSVGGLLLLVVSKASSCFLLQFWNRCETGLLECRLDFRETKIERCRNASFLHSYWVAALGVW